ncbi:uncharacterized protein LOC120010462 [Tripterygium wilfordii]|uniref:uncharacterized protein LOC120010462 n=1 Tax=Tripterygium wilfordii TaxID=458696 RepID=UPI0018F80BEC|nr:uncharacterized protein LOC120010462 [Tripterygium wilfordii]
MFSRCKRHPSDWAHLNKDLLEAIIKLLRFDDYIRVQAVCKLWRSVVKQIPILHEPHQQLPWLIMPDDSSDTCRFYSFSTNKFHRIELPELRGRRICGSSHGWMVVVDKRPGVFLLNPLTRSQIPLPPITTFPEIVDFWISELGEEEYHYPNNRLMRSGEFMRDRFFEKVILSVNPSLNSDYIVMAIYGDNHDLAFCREGDDGWTSLLHEEKFGFFDVVYWKESFYALNSDGNVVVLSDSGSRVPKINRILVTPYSFILERKRYLLVSGDELLMVSKRMGYGFGDVNNFDSRSLEYYDKHWDGFAEEYELDNEDVVDEGNEDGWNVHLVDDEDDDNDSEGDVNEKKVDEIPEWIDDRKFGTYLYKTNRFMIWKLDEEDVGGGGGGGGGDEEDVGGGADDDEEEEELDDDAEVEEEEVERRTWVEVTGLNDCMLFVGSNFGLSFSAKDFPECKADHIYFTDDHQFGYTKNLVGGHDLGAYNMKTREVESLPCFSKSTRWLIWPPPCWITLSAY